MKTLTFFSVLLVSAISLFAQVPESKWVGDTLGPWSVISFEEPTDYIQINPSAQNIWQIGAPQKTFFNQAFTIPNTIVTDSQSFYPVNNQSSFDLYIGDFNSNGYYYNLFIDFRHKFDTDTLQDGGFITVSWDHGQTWSNIRHDSLSLQYFFCSPTRPFYFYGNTSLYDETALLCNGEPGFSGNSGGWVHSCMAWYDLPVKKASSFPPDTMILRFNFISDNINNNKEGWMIDQIRLFSIDLGSGFNELSGNSIITKVNPNPIISKAQVTLQKEYDDVEFSILDIAGRTVSSGKPGTCRNFSFFRESLKTGIYFLKIASGTGDNSTCRIVFL
ncbi:MAG: T9SS type A sorting domain-containing protein [Bacteroidota bacterium]